MKTKFVSISALLAIFYIASIGLCAAGEISIATETLSSFLKQRGGYRGKGAVSQREKCPKSSADIQYITDYKIVPINDSSSAVSVFTMSCPEGNSVDQFLIIIQNGKGQVVASDLVGDSNFKGGEMWVDGNTLYLQGDKWARDDAHCCPSKEGTFEYNISTGSHKFKLKARPPDQN